MNQPNKQELTSLSAAKIGYLNAFTDNYIWFIRSGEEIIVIDPGESLQVLDYIISNKLKLKAIVLTHDHNDHMGGVADILINFQVPVYGMGTIPTVVLRDQQTVNISDSIVANTMVTPGHTYTSMCYTISIGNSQHLFCGDTLFAAGCGRVFTGDFVAMFDSLTKLGQLDPDTFVYPGHEYTLKNLQFAADLEPNNELIQERIKFEQNKLDTLGNSLPVTLAIELLTNPFLRCFDPDIVDAVGKRVKQTLSPGFECFVQLRELRNNF